MPALSIAHNTASMYVCTYIHIYIHIYKYIYIYTYIYIIRTYIVILCVQPVCSTDSALSELAEAGSAVIDELQSLLAELSRCSLMSVCHHLEQNLDLLSHAADNIVHCTSGTADMLREAKSIGKVSDVECSDRGSLVVC